MQRLDEFMGQALTAYYNNRDPLGVDGDFTTAPEISQLFGEIIGIWAVQQWIKLGSPSKFNLIEIGPGRGTLMVDLLRGTAHVTAFKNAMKIHLVETSEKLAAKQKEALSNHDVQWHDHLSTISSEIPSIIIANEFFDALPVRQFKYNGNEWLEHYIDGDKSAWQSIDNPPLKSNLPTPQNGDIFEYSETQEDYLTILSIYHGASLIIDYGYTKSAYGDTVQALYKHTPCPITDNIGDADLTSHIDFEWMSSYFENGVIKTQSDFLAQNGIALRYHQLNNPSLLSGYDRLINPSQMGELFKVLEILNLKS